MVYLLIQVDSQGAIKNISNNTNYSLYKQFDIPRVIRMKLAILYMDSAIYITINTEG